jgi:hypothetical protein
MIIIELINISVFYNDANKEKEDKNKKIDTNI